MEKANDDGRQQTIHSLKPELFGFEIVVASSNNGAVENITLELPQKDKIDESWFLNANYFDDLGELVSGRPAWGLISAARMVHGTIHTMQGQESVVVIVVLGGNTTNHGARNWAVSEPNLLNVAVTRAKRRLYVIGDISDWKSRKLFREVYGMVARRKFGSWVPNRWSRRFGLSVLGSPKRRLNINHSFRRGRIKQANSIICCCRSQIRPALTCGCFDRALISLAPIISSSSGARDIARNTKHPFVNCIRLADDTNEHQNTRVKWLLGANRINR